MILHMNTCNWAPGSLLQDAVPRCAKWLQVHTQTPNSSKALAPATADHPLALLDFSRVYSVEVTQLVFWRHLTLDQLMKIIKNKN